MAKVIFVSPTAWTLFCDPPRTSGGAELDLFNIAQGLIKQGYQCLFLTSYSKNPNYKIQITNKFQISNIQIFKHIPIIGGVVNTFRLWRELSRQKPDAVMVKGAGLIVFQVGLWAKLKGIKFIWRASHEQNFEPMYLHTKWWYWPYRLGLIWATKRIVQTHDQRQLLKSNFGLSSQVIYNSHTIPDSRLVCPTTKRSGIIWIGRARVIKQPNIAFEIAKRFPSVPLTMIVGEGDRQILNQIRDQAQTLRNIKLYESVPLNTTELKIAQSRVLLLTSLKEGLPNVYIQALKWGIPVVSVYVNPDNLVCEENGGVFCHGSIELANKSIKDLLSDNKWYNQLSRQARSAAQKYFDINAVINCYEELLR